MARLEPVQIEDDHRRSRRSRHEVHRLILESALQVFAEKGYAGASTKEIAERADVHESMVSRRFAHKAELFEAAVQIPFEDVVSRYLAKWEAQLATPASIEDLTRAFVEPLYVLLSEHRNLTLALVKSQGLPTDTTDGEQDAMQDLVLRLVDRMQPQFEVEGNRRHLRGATTYTVLAVVGMVAGVALFDQPFIDAQPARVNRPQLTNQMINLILYGVLPRAGQPTEDENPLTGHDPQNMARELLDRLLETERRATRAELELAQLREQTPHPSEQLPRA